MAKFENFLFGTTPILVGAISGKSAASTNEAEFADGGLIRVANTDQSDAVGYAEPEQSIRVKAGGGVVLDRLSRLIVFATREGGTGNWLANLIFRRDQSTTGNVTIPIVLALEGVHETMIQVIDNPFPNDFMLLNSGTAALDDTLDTTLFLTPGSATAIAFSVHFLIVPGHVANDSNKGAALSTDEFLTNP